MSIDVAATNDSIVFLIMFIGPYWLFPSPKSSRSVSS